MNKYQPVNFHSVEDFLNFLPEEELKVVEFLRQVIKSCMPFCKEKLSYNVPYYYINKRVLFIWPSSVPWGKVKKEGVMLGFCKGYLIPDEIGFLEKGNRKEVYAKTYFKTQDIDVDLLKSYIYSAIELDKSK
ncbi:DUF1801 domain-containing protein [Labilibacter marinus]|uniref:DUF1801 domain-containing protein n=1 Tax=Labilibacter marinus TaxID=1477105 RepID=UPI00083248E4|nr:DUF1801 domain-containing protein [Labilibacter marinus]